MESAGLGRPRCHGRPAGRVRYYRKSGGASQDDPEAGYECYPDGRRDLLSMSRRLLALNVVLAIVSIALIAGIERTLIVRRALPTPAAPRTATVPAPAPASENVDPGLSGYAAIAARNLFNPGRSDTAVATAPVVKPILHGVVIDGAKSRAFLEDPAAKRVAGYSAGDMIGDGKIQRISDDRVVIAKPKGLLEVLLRDPSKPKAPAVTAAPTQQTSTQQASPGAPTPPPEVPSQASQVAPSAPVRSRQSGAAPGGNRFYFGDTAKQ